MRVAHVVEAFAGGILTYMRGVLPELVRKGCEITLVCSLSRDWPDLPAAVLELKEAGVAVHIVSMSRGVNFRTDIKAIIMLYRIFSAGKFHVIHTHCSKAGVLGRVAARLAGISTVLHTPHCFAFLRCESFMWKLIYLNIERLLGILTTRLICVSQDEARVATRSKIIPAVKCTYLDNALDDISDYGREGRCEQISEIKKSFNLAPDSLVVTTICRLVDYKGVFKFIRSAEMSLSPNTIFLIAGEGQLRPEVEEWIAKRNLGHKVRLLGHVKDVESLYNVTDIVVLCSRAEGQSYVLIEAMRAGCSIVATDVPGNSGMIEQAKTGYIVPDDIQRISVTIDNLLANRRLRQNCVKNARTYFVKHHLTGNQVVKLLDLYAECSGTRGQNVSG